MDIGEVSVDCTTAPPENAWFSVSGRRVLPCRTHPDKTAYSVVRLTEVEFGRSTRVIVQHRNIHKSNRCVGLIGSIDDRASGCCKSLCPFVSVVTRGATHGLRLAMSRR